MNPSDGLDRGRLTRGGIDFFSIPNGRGGSRDTGLTEFILPDSLEELAGLRRRLEVQVFRESLRVLRVLPDRSRAVAVPRQQAYEIVQRSLVIGCPVRSLTKPGRRLGTRVLPIDRSPP